MDHLKKVIAQLKEYEKPGLFVPAEIHVLVDAEERQAKKILQSLFPEVSDYDILDSGVFYITTAPPYKHDLLIELGKVPVDEIDNIKRRIESVIPGDKSIEIYPGGDAEESLEEEVEDVEEFREIEEDEEEIGGTMNTGRARFTIRFSDEIEYEDEEGLSDIIIDELGISSANFKIDTNKNIIYLKSKVDAEDAFERIWQDYQHWRDFRLVLKDLDTGETKTHRSEE